MLKFLTAILFVFLVSCSPADLVMKAAGSVLGSGSSSGTSVNAKILNKQVRIFLV